MNSLVENQINKFILGKFIKKRETLSFAFNMKCEKITLNTGEIFIAKYYQKKNENFNSIISETNSLIYLLKKFPELFPSIKFKSDDLLIMDFIENNNLKNNDYQKILSDGIIKLHTISNDKYGFNFDAQIGGLKQINGFESNWVNFFRDKRLNMIFEEINKNKPMPAIINKKIEKLLIDLDNFLPKNPSARLLHGDLWSGNILFQNGKLAAFIDPGIYFGHNELEISYLMWFKYVDHNFFDHYSNIINIDKYYPNYEPIYQLYFSLLNVHLWSREYIKDVNLLLNKIY